MNSNAELIVRFYNNENYLNWENLFNRTSILRITKADRFEETHSLFIRYLLNPNENHGLGTKALEMFIRLLLVKNNKNNVLSKLSNELILKDKILRVPVLVPEKTDKRSRYDIYIEFESNNTKATIIIENKVFSSEHNNQTVKYEEYSKDYENPILIYLSNYDEPKSDKFIHITYQDLLDYVIEPLCYFTNSTSTKELLKDYMMVLSHVENKERNYTLAMSKDEKELLRNVFNENKELFERMFDALSTEDLSVEEKEIFKEAISITKTHKIKWLYKKEKLNSKQLVFNIVKEHLESGNSVDSLSKYKMHGYPLVILDPNDPKIKQDKYTKLELNDKVYYVRNCCDIENVLNLIKGLNVEVMRLEN